MKNYGLFVQFTLDFCRNMCYNIIRKAEKDFLLDIKNIQKNTVVQWNVIVLQKVVKVYFCLCVDLDNWGRYCVSLSAA